MRGPLIDVSLFTRPGFTAATLAALVVFFAFVGAIVYFSAYFQQVQGHSAVTAGVDVATIGVAYAIAATASGRLVGRIGERAPLITGLIISGGATLLLLRLAPETGIGAIWWNFALLGAGIGLCGTPMSTLAMSAVNAGPRRAWPRPCSTGCARSARCSASPCSAHWSTPACPPVAAAEGSTPRTPRCSSDGLHHALWVSGLALLAAAAITTALLIRPGPRR